MINKIFMKKILIITILIAGFAASASANIQAVWQEVAPHQVATDGTRTLKPTDFKAYLLNDSYLRSVLFAIPADESQAQTIVLPSPDGKMLHFRVWQTPVMAPELAEKFPDIKNFTAVCTEDPAITAKVNYTYKGFNAMMYNGEKTYLIDPYSNVNDGYYICYYKNDLPHAAHTFSCGVDDDNLPPVEDEPLMVGNELPKLAHKIHGSTKKTFRLALTCTGEYAMAVDGPNPTKPNVVSKMTNTVTRVNGILERELAITLQLISNNDDLVYLDPATDPFTGNENGSIGNNTTNANQNNTTTVIGPLNYDIGHIFCSGNGGIADLKALCDPGHKARGATGSPTPEGDAFDVDYVVHEIGHQLGAEHTFNYGGSGCSGHANQATAYEPGSGTTIMAYAGLCSGNDIQFNSDDYFHAVSMEQMTSYISSTSPVTCGSSAPSNNTPPSVASIQAIYNIPKETPFELTAPQAVDSDHDAITYCWEEYDLGDFGKGLAATEFGPILRSMRPVSSQTRVFPIMDSIRVNKLEYLGEKLPSFTRSMNFRLTVRDILGGIGTYHWSDNTVTLNVDDQAGPFVVQSPNTYTDYWRNGNSYTVKWDVANTNNAPVNCSNVDILLSYDDGVTYPVVLAANTPNDGSELVAVPPNSYTASARVKVKGANNVFFDISNAGFTINDWPDSINDVVDNSRLEIFPIPATNSINIKLIDGGYYDAVMTNTLGQLVWQAEVSQSTAINVSNMAAGIYQLNFTDKVSGKRLVRKVVVE